jgi:hypothetical protein
MVKKPLLSPPGTLVWVTQPKDLVILTMRASQVIYGYVRVSVVNSREKAEKI